MDKIPIQHQLAQYFSEWADVRRFQARSHAGDVRYPRSAQGLDRLAAYVRDLQPDDRRLAEFAKLTAAFRAGTTTFGEGVSRMTARFRFDDPDEGFERFLARLVMAAQDDADGASGVPPI